MFTLYLIIAYKFLRDLYMCASLILLIYMYINYIIVFCFNSIITCVMSRYLQKNIMKLVSNWVMKHPDF